MKDPCPFNESLEKNQANHVALSPLSFIRRAAAVYPNRAALVYEDQNWNWQQCYTRSRQLAASLARLGIGRGDTVATLLPNVPAMFESHFAIPMLGAVINAINIRLDAKAIAFILQHSNSKVLLLDPEFYAVAKTAIASLDGIKPIVINVQDQHSGFNEQLGEHVYEELLKQEIQPPEYSLPEDEWDAIALGYTSGTTGNPKGVVTHHRGAYLNAVSNVLTWHLPESVRYLWTLPMFHCNGWCFPWTLAAVGGTSFCLRRIDAQKILELFVAENISHYCGAPVVHAMIAQAATEQALPAGQTIRGLIAGAAPPASLLQSMDAIGIELTHVYGLTETYGPASVCAQQEHWHDKTPQQRAALNARQGVSYPLQEDLAVLDPDTLEPVPADGQTVGEIMYRGNIMMKGYLNNPSATEQAFSGGWFHTGDLAVVHDDGYVKITDRSKDVIISGGENISSIEVEDVILSHSDVERAAVVAMPDEKWGEVPAAFVQTRSVSRLCESELIEFCREHLARFKVPKKVLFEEIPTTSTGKIQKFELRKRLASLSKKPQS